LKVKARENSREGKKKRRRSSAKEEQYKLANKAVKCKEETGERK
jgi:hypothetical protein